MRTLITGTAGLWLEALARVAPPYAAKQGFQLFCRPWRPPLTTKQRAFLTSATAQDLLHEGYRVKTYRWGHGPRKILLLHGWQSHTYRWKAYIDAFPEDEYTLISLDAPGHGLSSGSFLSVPLYSSLVSRLVAENGPFLGVVGHSLGGFSLLYTVYREPDLPFDRMVLLAPPGEASDFIDVFRQTLRLSNHTINLVLDYFARRYSVTPDYFSTQRFAEKIGVPGLLIHDEGDREAPYPYSLRLHRHWKASQLITTKGLGHNLRSPEVVNHVVSYLRDPVTERVR